MHQITYVVRVRFPPTTRPQARHLWADAIAAAMRHNKDEVVSVEYDIQEVSDDFMDARQPGEAILDPPDATDQESSAYTEQKLLEGGSED